jgi:hypothetical protein
VRWVYKASKDQKVKLRKIRKEWWVRGVDFGALIKVKSPVYRVEPYTKFITGY